MKRKRMSELERAVWMNLRITPWGTAYLCGAFIGEHGNPESANARVPWAIIKLLRRPSIVRAVIAEAKAKVRKRGKKC